jgi:hypothetical protein
MRSWIDEGDVVEVGWDNLQYEYNLKVLYRPTSNGDSWIFERGDGTIIYVNQFSKIIRKPQ